MSKNVEGLKHPVNVIEVIDVEVKRDELSSVVLNVYDVTRTNAGMSFKVKHIRNKIELEISKLALDSSVAINTSLENGESVEQTFVTNILYLDLDVRITRALMELLEHKYIIVTPTRNYSGKRQELNVGHIEVLAISE